MPPNTPHDFPFIFSEFSQGCLLLLIPLLFPLPLKCSSLYIPSPSFWQWSSFQTIKQNSFSFEFHRIVLWQVICLSRMWGNWNIYAKWVLTTANTKWLIMKYQAVLLFPKPSRVLWFLAAVYPDVSHLTWGCRFSCSPNSYILWLEKWLGG